MTILERVVARVNVRIEEYETLREGDADLFLLAELAAAGIEECELGPAWETETGDWVWRTSRLIQYSSGRLATFDEPSPRSRLRVLECVCGGYTPQARSGETVCDHCDQVIGG